jgi:hypothetical protein
MFKRDQSGSVMLLFAFLLPVLMAAVGGGIEVSRVVEYKQRLTSATDLTCRQAEIYVESLPGTIMPSGYVATVQSYADKNSTERSLTSTAQITAKPTVSNLILTTPPLSVRPGNIRVVATGKIDLYFGKILNTDDVNFNLTRDCAVTTSTSSGPPALVVSESFEGYGSQLKGGWGVFGALGLPNCQSSACQNKSWGTTGAGVEVDQLSAIATGDGVQYGQNFAELDSDCSNRIGSTKSSQTTACNKSGQQTNSSINMTMDLKKGIYEVRYVYNARKGVGSYQYPDDNIICSNPSSADGLARDKDVEKNGAGKSTITLDGQTRRIELWVEPKTSGYLSDSQDLTASSNSNYVKSYMADVCVWSKLWIERSYKFTVPSAQEYRISWRAAGLDDSFGGLIDYLRICENSCP